MDRHDARLIDPFAMTRRHFLSRSAVGLGTAALSGLMPGVVASASKSDGPGAGIESGGVLRATHFAPRAKRIIYLCQAGGPSHLDLYDYKPKLNDLQGKQLPAYVRGEQRLTGMSSNQASIPLAGSPFKFNQHGEGGAWFSELLPNIASIADDICVVRNLYTEAINHDPAITFFQTGSQIAGRPSLGSWLSYGLGSENSDLPAFIVMVSAGQGGQPLYSRLWGSGFIDSRYQGVRFRAGKDPVLYLTDPDGVHRKGRRDVLDTLAKLNQHAYQQEMDPEVESRIAQYEMAFRMQTSVPGATDISDEPDETFELYGQDARKPGTFAANCLLARRLAEKDVRFIQLYHQGWDQHASLPKAIRGQCKETDQACAALVKDLKRRGLLDDTLVIWGGEFGRTAYCQGTLSKNNFGRDHHPGCFTIWMAGGGVKGGIVHGNTDDYGYNIVDRDGAPLMGLSATKTHKDAVHVHDLNATILHLMGIDHERLTYKHQGRRFRLTDVHGHVQKDLLL